jgi:hypothetical protein
MPSQGTRYSEPYAGPHGTTGFPFRVHSPRFRAHVTSRSSSISSAHRLPDLSFSSARQTHHGYPNQTLPPSGQIDQHSIVFYQTLRITIHSSDDERFETLTSKAGYNTGNGRSRAALTRAVIRAHNTREWLTLMSIVFFELSILPELKP